MSNTEEQRQAEHEKTRAAQRASFEGKDPHGLLEHDLKLSTALAIEDLRADVQELADKVENLGTVARQAAGAELASALKAVKSVERAIVHLHALASR